MSSILVYAVRAIAEGRAGETLKKLYWQTAGVKTAIGMVFGAAWAVLQYGMDSGACGKLGYDCSGWATMLGTVATFLIAVGLYDGAVRATPPNKLAGL